MKKQEANKENHRVGGLAFKCVISSPTCKEDEQHWPQALGEQSIPGRGIALCKCPKESKD